MEETARKPRFATRGLLGDSTHRTYGDKLTLFNRFAEPEIRFLMERLDLQPGARVLDAGCGVGLTTGWLAEFVGPTGLAVGCDLSGPHLAAARAVTFDSDPGVRATLVQCDIAVSPFRDETFDLVWCANTINHLTDPVAGIQRLSAVVKPGGRIVLVQSGSLPDMFFAWDERLERAVTSAVRQYYRDKYRLDERDTTAMRGLIRLAQQAGLSQVLSHTVVIERTAPLSDIDRAYFQHAVFTGYWGERLCPYMTREDWAEVQSLSDPESAAYCLDRPDFHHLQTLNMVTGQVVDVPSP